MKKSIITLFAALLFQSSAFAVQHFNCRAMPVDPLLNDRAIIALMTDSEGTLFLTSGLDDFGNQDSTGPHKLSKISQTKSDIILEARNTSSVFTVTIPFSALGQNSDQVFLKMNLKNAEREINQNLDCFTRMY